MKNQAKYYVIEDAEIGENTVLRDYVNIYGCKIGKNCKYYDDINDYNCPYHVFFT